MSESLKLLFTTDFGLLSLGVIVFIVVMGFYLSSHLKKLMNQQPGKEGLVADRRFESPRRLSPGAMPSRRLRAPTG